MTDLRKFLTENKENVHELLNHMWQTIEQIAFRFENTLPDVDLDNTHGNFVEINDGWSEAVYANPTLTFPYGEIGYSLDGLYCVVAVAREKMVKEHLLKIMEFARVNDEITIEIYGGDDCFTTLYHSRDEADFDDLLKKIEDSPEEILQIDFSVDALPEEEVKEALLTVFLQAFTYLSEHNCLSKLPSYK